MKAEPPIHFSVSLDCSVLLPDNHTGYIGISQLHRQILYVAKDGSFLLPYTLYNTCMFTDGVIIQTTLTFITCLTFLTLVLFQEQSQHQRK